MEYSKLPKLNIGGLLIAVLLGILVAVGLYQAQVRGLMPSSNLSFPKVQNLQTEIVVKEENAIIDVVDKTSSSVVAIGINKRVINLEDRTIGTGFVVSKEKGIIVTNKHVVSDKGQYRVITKDGQKYDVKKIYRDPVLDLGIVQIEGSSIPSLDMGDSSKLKVGQTVIAIGNALGNFTNTVTTGVVSGLGRKVVAGDISDGSLESLDNLIQTDAAINPGNSGGPLLSSGGQVIGVNVATTEGAQNIGFAIPINSVKQIVDEFVQKGFVSRPYLGIKYRFITKDVAILNEVPQGAYIQDIAEGGPAQRAEVKIGDIIARINGQTIDAENKVADIVSKANIGASLTLTVWRSGKQSDINVTLGESPAQ